MNPGFQMAEKNYQEDRHQLPTGTYYHSNNYKAEVEAIKKAAEILVDTTFTKVVILTDALSVLQALEAEDKNLNDLSTSLTLLSRSHRCTPMDAFTLWNTWEWGG